MILGIDPGSEETAFAIMTDDYEVADAGKIDNDEFLDLTLPAMLGNGIKAVVIEGIQSYGMAVGKTVFETCYVVGECRRVAKMRGKPVYIYSRPEYARAIVGGMKANDALIRGALINRFGGDKKGEPLNKLKGNSDKRSAFAVAVYHADKMRCEGQ